MSASIVKLLDMYPEMTRKVIDQTFEITSAAGGKYRRGLPDPALARFIPQTRYVSAKLAIAKIAERRPTLASIVAVDGEMPLRREPVEFQMEMMGSVKLGRARLFTEEDFDLLREAELYLAANQPEIYQEYVARYMQAPAILTQGVTSLAALLLLQLYANGSTTYIDPETKLGFELSYLSQVPAANRPVALTGTDTWTTANVTTSKPLEHLRDHLNAYYGTGNGVFTLPDALAMSGTVADGMLNSNDTKYKIGRMLGRISDSVTPTAAAIASLPRPSIQECRDWLSREITASAQGTVSIPEFIVSDATYYTMASDGRINQAGTSYLPSNAYVFLTEGVVEGAYVPTATNNYASTMALITEEVSKAPKREKASIDTRFLALCLDPRMLGWRQVA